MGALPDPDRFPPAIPTGFILADLSLLLSFLRSAVEMLPCPGVGALETRWFGRCEIKAELIYFALNVILTVNLFIANGLKVEICVSPGDRFDRAY